MKATRQNQLQCAYMNRKERRKRAAKVKQLRDMTWTIPEISRELHISLATCYRDLDDSYRQRNVNQNRERKRHGRKPLPARVCPACCERFQPSRHDQRICTKSYCKRYWIEYSCYHTPIPAHLLREHIEIYGLTEESATRLGMTLDELREALND